VFPAQFKSIMSPSLRIDPAIVLAGGLKLPVETLAGEPAEVFIRLLRQGEDYRTLIQLSDDHCALAEWITGHPAGWARTEVQPHSVTDIVEKAMDLNFSLARRWAELRARLSAATAGEAPPSSVAAFSPSRPSSPPTPA
jgi:hypothetical protein